MADERVRATPLWFGPAARPLFGWLHLPASGHVRGGVVLFPPLAIEAICTYFTYRLLATRLAADGLAVVRFDYDGTGDSVGDEHDPDRTDAWLASSTAATDLLRSRDVNTIGFVGIRMGGLFAAREAIRLGGVDALVLWDTCLSGRTFLREQQALRLLSLGGNTPDGAIDAPGLRFSAPTVETLSGLDLGRPGEPLATRVLVLEHPGRARPARLERRLEGCDVDWAQAAGQEGLLDPPRQATPWVTIENVADWLVKRVAGTEAPATPPPTRPAVVATSPDGDPVHEFPVTFGSGLFGILTEPAHPRPWPTVVFVNEGNTPHIGQSRLWVELARSWGAAGLRVLRFDLSGHGDSPPHPGQRPHGARDPEALGDVLAAAEFVSPQNRRDVVLVGLCAGAYQAVETALDLQPRGVCLVNPHVTFVPSETVAGHTATRRAVQGTRGWLAAAARGPVRWLAGRIAPHKADDWERAVRTGSWTVSLAKRRPNVPGAVWEAIHRLLITGSPAVTFERLVQAGVDVVVVCGPDDAPLVTVGQGKALARLEASPLFHLTVLDGLDHAALLFEERQRLRQVLTEYVLAGQPSSVKKPLPRSGHPQLP